MLKCTKGFPITAVINTHVNQQICKDNTALLWQKEASDIPSKSELVMFLYFTRCALLPGQILCINAHPAKRYVSYDIRSLYSIEVSENFRHILLFYKKFHFCHLLPFAKVGQNNYNNYPKYEKNSWVS